jgi:hypothetical protein
MPVSNKFDYRGHYTEYGVLNINTQILAHNRVFFEQSSWAITTLYNIFKKTLRETLCYDLTNHPIDFLPKIDYSFYDIKKIVPPPRAAKTVLICNNEIQSAQAINFNINDMLRALSVSYPNINFIATNDCEVKNNNITFMSEYGIVGGDLNEISYLSTLCDVVIGRNSGPYSFCMVSDNILDKRKNMVTFIPPSSLYGPDPGAWLDLGVSQYLGKGDMATFHNILTLDDGKRIDAVRNGGGFEKSRYENLKMKVSAVGKKLTSSLKSCTAADLHASGDTRV